VLEDKSTSLCARSVQMLERLENSYTQGSLLSAKLRYSECKKKSKFTKLQVEFKQCRLYISKSSSENVASFNIEEITIYIGHTPKKSPSTRYCLTFLVKGEKMKSEKEKNKDVFGHCLCFDSEDELYKWAACLYVAQNPDFFSWKR